MNTTQYSTRPKRSAICNMCFLGPTRVVDANDISIDSAVFAGLTRWQTDWQTDRPRYSVGNDRRSAQWRSQILLLSTATTSIYWSSRLDRSDQLQQSAAIFSCKTRWLYCVEWTQYSIRLESVRYIQQVFPWTHPIPERKLSRSLPNIFAGLTMWQTDRQTDRPRY